MIRHSIATKLLVSILAVATTPLLLAGYLGVSSFQRGMETEIARTLGAKADAKIWYMNQYFEEKGSHAAALALFPSIATALKSYEAAFATGGPSSAAYEAANARFETLLLRQQEAGHYYDLFLISSTGDVVFTVAREADLGTNLMTGPWRHTQLAETFRRTISRLEPTISDFGHYAPSGRPAAFVGAPVLDRGRLVGVLATQISTREIYNLASDYTGLGETGETVLAVEDNAQALLVAPTRHDPQAPLSRHIDLGSNLATPIIKGLNGESGTAVALDYRSRKVLATWRYLPRLRWGIVLKIDADEAFAPIEQLSYLALGISIIAVGLVVAAARVVSRFISKPIENLTRTAVAVSGGDLRARAEVSTHDELSILATAFNDMLARLTTAREAAGREHWLKACESELFSALRGEKPLELLARDITSSLAQLVDAQVGALFAADDDQTLCFAGGYAFRPTGDRPPAFAFGEGLVGQAAQDRACLIVDDLPDDHLDIPLGPQRLRPRNVLLIPFSYEGATLGVIELGSVAGFSTDHLSLAKSVAESIGIAVNGAQSRRQMTEFLATREIGCPA